MQAIQNSHFLTVFMSVSENSEGDSDAANDYLEMRIGSEEMAILDRMVVAARLCDGDVTVNRIPVLDMGGDEIEASVVADKYGRLSLSSFARVKHAWPIEVTSDGLLYLDSLKKIRQHNEDPMVAFSPLGATTVYATPTEDLEQSEDFLDLVNSVMTDEDEEQTCSFEALFQGERDLVIRQNVEPTNDVKNVVYVVSGREYGNDDDTVVTIEAPSEAEASARFTRHLKEETFEEGPTIYVNSIVTLSDAITQRLA